MLAVRYAELVYYGQWFTPLKRALDAFVEKTQERVTGTARVKLYKGSCTIAGIKSPYSLYREDLATFGADQVYNQRDAEGFINLFGLPIQVEALLNLGPGAVPAKPEEAQYMRD
ncbi:MAG: argininosuccinate synthase, partial [Anaerolineae bacterium]|nr:argininosuccinate synthase [Anaerolineae bacterium]